jgi:signal transduction protein with GAF and PtsI domain
MLSPEYFPTRQHLHQQHDIRDVGLANSLQDLNHGIMSNLDAQFDDEDALGNRLTKCLAETAVAVRDMSKQLGMPILRVTTRVCILLKDSL